jgi:hypothetical protein
MPGSIPAAIEAAIEWIQAGFRELFLGIELCLSANYFEYGSVDPTLRLVCFGEPLL